MVGDTKVPLDLERLLTRLLPRFCPAVYVEQQKNPSVDENEARTMENVLLDQAVSVDDLVDACINAFGQYHQKITFST